MRKKDTFLIYMIFVGMVTTLGLWKPVSVSVGQWSNILLWSGLIGIVGIGQTMAIITGGIDVSVGALVLLTTCLTCQIMGGSNAYILPALLTCIGVGGGVGFVNGVGITKGKIPPMVMTIAMMISLSGVTLLVYGGGGRGYVAPAIEHLIDTYVIRGIPVITVIWLILTIIGIIVLRKTTFGRKIYAIGSNSTATFFSGIDVDKIIILVYIISGVLSALTGFIFAGYIHSANLAWSDQFTLPSIAAVVVGGTTFTGGIGGLGGTIVGILIIRFLTNFFYVIRIPEFGKEIMLGVIIIIALAFYGLEQRKGV